MAVKKIGDYLIEKQTCDEQMIDAALERQVTLEHEGIYKPLGQIIVESGDLSHEVLDSILRCQGEDMLRSVDLFKSLPPSLIAKIADVAECRAFPKDEIIIHEGDQGDSFYQVISGLTRVFRVSDEGVDVTLATLGPGEGLGEMALLTGEPRSASVETIEASGFLVIQKQAFDQLAAEIPEFSLALSKILSSRLSRGGAELVHATATEKAYQRFVSEQSAKFEPKMIGRSRIVKRLQSRINEVAANDKSVLIFGESGTEKGDVAGLIHRGSARKDGPFLVVDIKTVNMGRTTGRPKERDPLRLEIAQSSTLFGHAKGALSFAPERRLGLFQVGDNGTVVVENIEHLGGSVQRKLADFIKQGSFEPLGSQNRLHSSVRVVATSSADLEQLVQDGGFDKQLFELLGGGYALIVPPLRKRKKDLKQLVDCLLKHYGRRAGKTVSGIDREVYKNIMAYDWPGNTDELKVVIRRGVNLVQNSQLTPDDILIGMAPQVTGKFSFNLLKLDRVQQLFRSSAFPNWGQLVAAFLFGLIIYLGFFGSQTPNYNVSLELTWGLWEPLVVLGCILAARIWCAVCPIGASSSLISHKYGLNRNVPPLIRNYGIYLAAAGLGGIFLSEVVFDMLHSPRATAMLIVSITLPALILALVYRRRAWCRFLCPLGKLVGFLSSCSLVELRANHNICNNDCMENSCYVGNEDRAGCPVFEAPFVLHSNQNCILCGNCIKSCPHQSPVLNLRVPGQELWAFRKPDMAIALLGPLMMGTQLFRGLEKAGYFHSYAAALNQQWILYLMLIVITTALAFIFVRTAGRDLFEPVKAEHREKTNLMAYALVPLVAIFELSFHFERLISRGGQLFPTLGRQLGFDWSFLGVSIGPWLVKGLQIGFVLLGVFASGALLKKLLNSRRQISIQRLSFGQQWPIWLLAAVYVWLFFMGSPNML